MLGPLSSQAQVDRVNGYIQKGIDEGAKLVTGGTGKPEGLEPAATSCSPRCSPRSRNDMTIAQEEIFGPVLSILPYDDRGRRRRHRQRLALRPVRRRVVGRRRPGQGVARRIRTGQIEVNGGAFNPNAPFGGYKQSGYGREYGEHGFEEFLEIKSHAALATRQPGGSGARTDRCCRRFVGWLGSDACLT